MIDRSTFRVGEQVLLADIGDVGTVFVLCQQVIIWLIAIRAQVLRNGLVPFFAIGEDRVNIEDHSAKIECAMAHDIANSEAGTSVAGSLDGSASLGRKEHGTVHNAQHMGFRRCETRC